MKKIEQILDEKNVDLKSLPTQIKKAVSLSKKHYANWEAEKNLLTDESTDEDKAEVEELGKEVEAFIESISDAIDDFLIAEEEAEAEAKAKEEAEVQAKAETSSDEVIEEKVEETKPKVQPQPVEAKPIEEKKKIGFGTFILGVGVLIATAGAVNMMRKK